MRPDRRSARSGPRGVAFITCAAPCATRGGIAAADDDRPPSEDLLRIEFMLAPGATPSNSDLPYVERVALFAPYP